MVKKITCFIPFADRESLEITISNLISTGAVEKIYVVAGDQTEYVDFTSAVILRSDNYTSTKTFRLIAEESKTEFTLIYTKVFPLDPGKYALQRMMQVCTDTDAGMVYSGYWENKDGKLSPHPLIDYQEGSLRDDFSFGSVLLYRSDSLREACSRMKEEFSFAAPYDLRLKVSQNRKLVYLPELLYTEIETDTRKSGEKQFDYVDPRNRAVQQEMERACISHLKDISAWLPPLFREVDFKAHEFAYEASVIIPVKNRVKTITDAVNSVLSQETAFRFNLIVIDNYSDDGTTEIIKTLAKTDDRIVHIIPERKGMGIGGCWNEGIFSRKCGKFAIQLDSDDLYIDNNVITTVVNAFYEQRCAMVIGSYKMVNFQLQDIPPGLIDHREWTPENGRNNALRINGLGAPRAFYTPVLREIRIPDVSYGEDYAVGLAISRHYQIGRIYDPLYLCRRWEDNSDASLDISKMNLHNLYKDKIRTIELLARKQLAKKANQ